MSGKVIVSQLGARMHYAVPAIFASQDRLAHFYTDICATKGWYRFATALPASLTPAAVRRFAGRQPKNVSPNLITIFPAFGIRSALRRMRGKDVVDETSHALWAGAYFSRLVAQSGFHGADGIYAFSGDALEQMRAAKQQGLWTALEQMIAPRDVLEQLLQEEAQSFPDWTGPLPKNAFARIFADREKAEWNIADLIICPSEFVRRHVVASGGDESRCVVVPYGVDVRSPVTRPRRLPGPLRVLTAGAVGLRKGSPYVVQAAQLLGGSATFRMVGPCNLPETLLNKLASSVELAGIIPRAAMAEQYRWADIFLLPSICEGSATVIYEALAAGLPVITTENTGSVVRDGKEGFVVPLRDSQAIAQAIERLAKDEELRAEMSVNAFRQAADFTVEKYGTRLLAAIAPLSSKQVADRPRPKL
ncbi:glycosyltransferase family 4 protein [Rhizobium sp. R693]|uniref:glycosyltransferase family 4 protein n=1 Tax=Rhizobium sp. R693 TaxID=1764276 RepID=UPI000B5380B5|nr:glycosyltransferase family 4 protein [Rhizobium sp. R693]OWV84513.1 glycoside hydrolase [Rhizobium sp. R693]